MAEIPWGLTPMPGLSQCEEVSPGSSLRIFRSDFKGKNESFIYRGYFQSKTPVAVRKFPSDYATERDRDRIALITPQNIHENFLRFIFPDTCGTDQFIAMELCICSVADLYPKLVIDHEDLWLIKAGLGIRSILRQATEGLAFLHGSGHIHRNIKPSNFLVAKIPSPQSPSGMKHLIKICDFRLSKLLSENNINSGTKGSDGWTAPESAKKGIELTYQYDTFILGCFFYWLIKDGEHPFGEPSKRFMNMLKPKYPTYANLPDIDDQLRPLISRMIQYDSSKRPALTEILNDSYFQEINYSLYDAPNVKPGLIVIINEQEFAPEVQTKLPNRKGSEHDVRNLENVFRNFGFDVRIKENLTAFDLDTYLSDLAKENFTQYASLVICVLSHGHQGAVYGTDGKSVALNTIKFKFSIEDCPSMQDKPKIFVFQACQSPPSQPEEVEYVGSQLPPNEPITDALTLKGTVEGYDSFRCESTGSLFINGLCNRLRREYTAGGVDVKDVYAVFRDLQNEMHTTEIYVRGNTHVHRQVVEYSSSLRYSIRFRAS